MTQASWMPTTLLALEPRFMFDGAAVGDAHDALANDPVDQPTPAESESPSPADDAGPVTTDAPARQEIVFVDSSVTGYEALAAAVRDGVETVVLDGDRDGLAQIAAHLDGRSGIDAIHIIGHGGAGEQRIGTTELNADTLASRADTLAAIGAALSAEGDILLYGCRVADGDGRVFIDDVARLTGADIAASDDVTANAAQGGDWVLEDQTGAIEADRPFDAERLAGFTGDLDVSVDSPDTGVGSDKRDIVWADMEEDQSSPDYLMISGAGAVEAGWSRALGVESSYEAVEGVHPALEDVDDDAMIFNSGGVQNLAFDEFDRGTYSELHLVASAYAAANGRIYVQMTYATGEAVTLTVWVRSIVKSVGAPTPSGDEHYGGYIIADNLAKITFVDGLPEQQATNLRLNGTKITLDVSRELTSVSVRNYSGDPLVAVFGATLVSAPNATPAFTSGAVTVAVTDTTAIDTFTPSTGTLAATDADLQTVTYGVLGGTTADGTVTKAGTYGTLSANAATGAWTYTPNAGAVNAIAAGSTPTETFTVTATDGTATTNQTFTVNLTGANDAPTVSNRAVSGSEDNSRTFRATDFTAAFTDVDAGNTLAAVRITALPANGTLRLGTAAVTLNQEIAAADLGLLRFVPAADWNGDTTFTWQAQDGGTAWSGSSTTTISIAPVNDAPVITNTTTPQLIFRADPGFGGGNLWITDGTTDGTQSLHLDRLLPNASASVNGLVVFSGQTNETGAELWVTDGTVAGTRLLKDINSGVGHASPGSLTVLGGKVYFHAFDGTDTGLWVTDGTEDGTQLVKVIADPYGYGEPRSFVVVNNRIVFSAFDGALEAFGLWVTDGTADGTLALNVRDPGNIAAANGLAFFSTSANDQGRELWVSDGTASGTRLVKDIVEGADSSNPFGFAALGDKVLFSAKAGERDVLWVTDGTASGTTMLSEVQPQSTSTGTFFVLGGRAFFRGNTVGQGSELWVTDGTADGTALFKDINPAVFNGWGEGGAPEKFLRFGDKLIFQANDGVTGRELWATDGTEAGTVLVKDIYPGSDSSDAQYFHQIGDNFVFRAGDGIHDNELWVSDGTPDGTRLLKDIHPSGHGDPLSSAAAFSHIAATMREGGTAATTITATDVENDTRSFSIAGGADAALFTIDSATGALAFAAAPRHAAPADTGHDNIYDVRVQVTDGNGGTAGVMVKVTVTAGPPQAPASTTSAQSLPAPPLVAEAPRPPPPIPSADMVTVIRGDLSQRAGLVTIVRDATPKSDAGLATAPSTTSFGGQGAAFGGQSSFAPAAAPAFQIGVLSNAARQGLTGDALVATRPVAETLPRDGRISFTLPADSFAHSRGDAVVQLNAVQADGKALPSWLSFDARTGSFAGQPPTGANGELVVQVIARDQDGKEAVVTLRINLQPAEARSGDAGPGIDAEIIAFGDTVKAKAGKPSFSAELHLASRQGGQAALLAAARQVARLA